jgi:hypothetical protein
MTRFAIAAFYNLSCVLLDFMGNHFLDRIFMSIYFPHDLLNHVCFGISLFAARNKMSVVVAVGGRKGNDDDDYWCEAISQNAVALTQLDRTLKRITPFQRQRLLRRCAILVDASWCFRAACSNIKKTWKRVCAI